MTEVRKRLCAASRAEADTSNDPVEAKRMKSSVGAELSGGEDDATTKSHPDSYFEKLGLSRAAPDTSCAERRGDTVSTPPVLTGVAAKLGKRRISTFGDRQGLQGDAGPDIQVDIMNTPAKAKRIKISDNEGVENGSSPESGTETRVGSKQWKKVMHGCIRHSRMISDSVSSLCDQIKSSVNEYIINTIKTTNPGTYPTKTARLMKVLSKLAVLGQELSKLNEVKNPLDYVTNLGTLMHNLIRQAATNLTEDLVFRNINIRALMEQYSLYRSKRLKLDVNSSIALNELDMKYATLQILVREAVEDYKKEINFIREEEKSPFLKPSKAESGFQAPSVDPSFRDSKGNRWIDPQEGCSWHYPNLECSSRDPKGSSAFRDTLMGHSLHYPTGIPQGAKQERESQYIKQERESQYIKQERVRKRPMGLGQKGPKAHDLRDPKELDPQRPKEEHDRQHPREERYLQNPRDEQDPQRPREEHDPQRPREEHDPQRPREEHDPQRPREERDLQNPREEHDPQRLKEEPGAKQPKEEHNLKLPKQMPDLQLPKQEHNSQRPKEERDPQRSKDEHDSQYPKQECSSQEPNVLDQHFQNEDMWAQVLETVTKTLEQSRNESKVPPSLDGSDKDQKVPIGQSSLGRSVEDEVPMELHDQPEASEFMAKLNTLHESVKNTLNKTEIPLNCRKMASDSDAITKTERRQALLQLNEYLWEIGYELKEHYSIVDLAFSDVESLYYDYVDSQFVKDALLESFLKKSIPNLFKPN